VKGLPRISGKAVLDALLRGGFQLSHIRSSHHYLRRPDGTGLVVVPVHGNRDLPAGTLRSILQQAEITAEELRQLL
jgi:predicted RNA binding protein YcfA (HicA-like mRNA interferase family)